jgi:superoxide reductase
MLEDKGVPISCCNTPMQLLKANSTDAVSEKHVPAILEKTKTSSGVPVAKVQVGSVPHPMLPEHSIN